MQNFFGFAKELLDSGKAELKHPYGDNNLYDLAIQFDYDLQFYREFACKADKVLDLACGTGRILLPLLQHGVDVVGIDKSAAMLKIAADKCSAYGFEPQLFNADMREFSLPMTFDLVIVPYHSMMYILSDQDKRQVFERIANHMDRKGLLVFDFDAGKVELGESLPWLALQGIHPMTNEIILQIAQINGLEVNLRLINQINYYIGEQVRINVEYSLESTTSAQNMQQILQQSGFKVKAVYGDYDKHQYEDGSECIIVARKL